MNFAELVSSNFGPDMSSLVEDRQCPDQYVGLVNTLRHDEDFSERCAAHLRPLDTPCLIFILESPHTSEFVGSPAPAKGVTGKRIRENVGNMDCFSEFFDYGIILVNAIQYQCSLGFETKRFRDRVFKHAWDCGGQASFLLRLEKYFRSGDVVVNCCTKGYGYKKSMELRVLVQQAIKEAFPDLEPMRKTHPSSWYSARNRDFQWKYPF